MLPITLGVASFVVQSHVGYSLVAACLIAFALVGLFVSRRRSRSATGEGEAVDVAGGWRISRVAAISVVVLAVCWLPPVIDQLTTGDNLAKIVRYFRNNAGNVSWTEAFRVVALQWSWRPDWLLGAKRPDLFVGAGSEQAAQVDALVRSEPIEPAVVVLAHRH